MTRAQWDDSINLMIRRHNMPPLDDKDRAVVLGYLEATYPARAAGRGGGRTVREVSVFRSCQGRPRAGQGMLLSEPRQSQRPCADARRGEGGVHPCLI